MMHSDFLLERGVAQPGSASGLGPEGRRFESCRPDQKASTAVEAFFISSPRWQRQVATTPLSFVRSYTLGELRSSGSHTRWAISA